MLPIALSTFDCVWGGYSDKITEMCPLSFGLTHLSPFRLSSDANKSPDGLCSYIQYSKWPILWAVLTRYRGSLRAGRSEDRIPLGGQIFCTRPDQLWDPPTLLYNGYLVFPGVKAAGAWRWPPTPSCAEFKERVQLYVYSPFWSSWLALRWTLPLSLNGQC
jgi:hypothetical protein